MLFFRKQALLWGSNDNSQQADKPEALSCLASIVGGLDLSEKQSEEDIFGEESNVVRNSTLFLNLPCF
jgi:hypothetical protein